MKQKRIQKSKKDSGTFSRSSFGYFPPEELCEADPELAGELSLGWCGNILATPRQSLKWWQEKERASGYLCPGCFCDPDGKWMDGDSKINSENKKYKEKMIQNTFK